MDRVISRREFLRLGALSAAGVALASCAQPRPTAEPEATAVVPAEEVTLRLWTMNDPGWVAASQELIKRWEEANPSVRIKHEQFPYDELIQTIQTGMAAKTEADLIEMFGSWVQSYAKGGTIEVMPEEVISLSEARKRFYDAPLDGYVWEGKLYGLPHEYNIENGGVLVNKRIFDESGVEYPPEWANWDELVQDAKKLTKWEGETMTVAGFHYLSSDTIAFLLFEGILERGADYFAEDRIHLNMLTPQAEETLQWMVDMALKDKVVDPLAFNSTVADVADSFFRGQVAIGYRGPWVVPGGRVNYPDFKDPWDYVSAPHYGEQMKFAADSGWGLVVSPNSSSKAQAWEFVKFCTLDKTNHRIWNVNTGTVPALKEVAEDPTLLEEIDWIGPSLKVLPYGRYVGDLQDRDFIWYDVIETEVLNALNGQQSVQETLEKITTRANEMIDSKLKT